MELLTAKNFIKKHKAPIIFSILTVLVFTAFLWEEMVIATCIICPILMIFLNFKEQINLIMYMVVFSGRSPVFIVTILFCFLCTCVKYVVDVVKKQKPVFVPQLALTGAILLVFSLIHSNVNTEGFYNWAMFVCLLCFAYLAFVYHSEIDVNKAFKTLILSVCVSAAIGVLVYVTGIYKGVYYSDDVVHRLRLFTYNVNQLGLFCLFGICYLVSRLMHNHLKNGDWKFLKNKNFWLIVLFVIVLAIIGLLTMSKAFLLMLGLLFVYLLVYLVVRYKLKSLVFFGVLAVMLVPLGFIFKDYISSMLSRFVAYDKWNGLLSKITTGRSDIWFAYLKECVSSLVFLIFGKGLLSADLIRIGPHNVFIYLLYRVGIVGILALAALTALYLRSSKTKFKISLENVIVFAMFLIVSLEEMIFSDRFFLILVFGVMMLLESFSFDKVEREISLAETENKDLQQKTSNE